ncbi:MAG: hypothetical protein PHU31_11490 [Anaerotignum sp.]|nr:hypothetical protein [Anaerotignum sp.]
MKYMKEKLGTKGETIIETLVAILILTVSAMLLAEVSAAAVRMNQKIEDVDKNYRDELAVVEKQDASFKGEITIKRLSDGHTYTYDVNFFGNEGDLTSYQAKAEGIEWKP